MRIITLIECIEKHRFLCNLRSEKVQGKIIITNNFAAIQSQLSLQVPITRPICEASFLDMWVMLCRILDRFLSEFACFSLAVKNGRLLHILDEHSIPSMDACCMILMGTGRTASRQ